MGFELEFGNVPLQETSQIIQKLYGGEVKWKNRFSLVVENTRLGEFELVFDARLLHEKTYQKPFRKMNIDMSSIQLGEYNLEAEVENVLASVASILVPYEIGTPPVAITQLQQLEPLREALFLHNAKGTKAFLTNAFATHINPEAPDTSVETLLGYIRAFLLLYPWMLRNLEIDLARRITPYIDPFPTEYADKVLPMSYQPDLVQLIEDYHAHNPDRNRPLDMYPIFSWLAKDRVEGYADIGKLTPRPTFHFRLPNSQMEEEDWSLEKVWNSWVKVEDLAADEDKLNRLGQEYLRMRKDIMIGFKNKWANHTEKWI